MNKEALRKELEDCWGKAWNRGYFVGRGRVLNDEDKDTYITTRLAALDRDEMSDEKLKSLAENEYPYFAIPSAVLSDKAIKDQLRSAFIKGLQYNHKSFVDDGQEGKGLMSDPFIQKHLKIIMDKMADANIVSIIEKMWGGLEMASVEHFMQTGKVNGSFHLRLKELMYHFAERWHNTAALPVADGDDWSNQYRSNELRGFDGEGEKVCPRCHGDGMIEKHIPGYEGVPEKDVMIQCPDCEGSGIQP